MTDAGRTGLRAVVLAVIVGLSSASAAAQSVESDYDRSYDFSKLRTFDFAPQTRGPNDPLAINPLNERRVRAALDSQLVAQGFTRDSTSGKPDFMVVFHAATRNRLNVTDWSYGPGRWGGRRIDVNKYTEGTLVVDVVNGAKKELVWRGTATGTVQPKDADKKIRNAVAKMMKQFAKDRAEAGKRGSE